MARGIGGFDGAGRQDFDLALGHVTGFRWWRLAAPDLACSPVHADRDWARTPLAGQTGHWWEPGVQEAKCNTDPQHKPPVEYEGAGNGQTHCGCGWWCYWEPREHAFTVAGAALPVLGVVAGTGRTLLGPLGFRSQQARVIALHLACQIVVTDPAPPPQEFSYGPPRRESGSTWRDVLMTPARARERAQRPGMEAFDDWLRHGDEPPAPAAPEGPDDHALAWMGVIEDRLASMYSAKVYATRASMIADFPPDPAMPAAPPAEHAAPWA